MTTYQHATIQGYKIFYREAGSTTNPTIVLLHGFPSSSHMFRDLIPQLSKHFHVIAPDYLGFGYSDAPAATDFQYTFDNLTAQIEHLLFSTLGLKKFSIYVQDYGAPVGFRIASRHPEAIEGIIAQNGNAYLEGIGPAFKPMQPFWETPSDLDQEATKKISGALNALLADVFALYLKSKNFHWHMSGPHFRDYHLLIDEQSDELFAMVDDIAERVRKIGGLTVRSIGQISRLQRLKDNDADFVTPQDMLTELYEDNRALKLSMKSITLRRGVHRRNELFSSTEASVRIGRADTF